MGKKTEFKPGDRVEIMEIGFMRGTRGTVSHIFKRRVVVQLDQVQFGRGVVKRKPRQLRLVTDPPPPTTG